MDPYIGIIPPPKKKLLRQFGVPDSQRERVTPLPRLIGNSLLCSRRPYCIENAGSHLNSTAKRCKARSVLGWGTARELQGVDSFILIQCEFPDSQVVRTDTASLNSKVHLQFEFPDSQVVA